jgi:hypothetical protein
MGAMTAIAATGALASGIQAISGAKQRRDAQRELENYQRQELQNVAEGLQVSTLGADLQREEQARLASTQVGALQGAGVRGLVGGLGRVEAGNQMVNREIGAGLDMQQKQIDQMYAQDQANIRGMQEQREVADIAGLSSQYNAGNAMLWQGIGGIAQSGMSAISGGLFNNTPAEPRPQQTQVSQVTPMSLGRQVQPVGGATFQQPTLMPQAVIPSQANNYGITGFNGITFNPYQQQ